MTARDYRRIVDDIQTALCSQSAIPIEAVQGMSLEYVTACEDMNLRLRECQDLLRRGLRGEALQRSDIEPKLVDAVAVLDFPELGQWLAILAQLQLVAPPPLLYEVAAELNEAYAKERPLVDLLRKHRLLALGRASLRDRITVLRRIAKLDPGTSMWQEDARVWETARQAEIVALADKAFRQENADVLSELEQELTSPEWLAPPSAVRVRQISGYAVQIRARRAYNEMKRLEEELTAAHQEFDIERGRRIRSRWDDCAKLAALPEDHALIQTAEPALSWLAQEDAKERQRGAYDEAVALLVQALDDDMPPMLLERRYNALVQLGEGVEEALAHRYQVRMEEYRLAVTRKHRLMLTGVAAAFLMIAALTGFLVFRQVRSNALANNVAALKLLIDDGKHSEAGQFLDQLATAAPDMFESAEVQDLRTRLDGIRRREDARRTAFLETLGLARNSLDDAKKLFHENPDRTTLQSAEEQAVGESEKTEAAALKAEYDRYVAEMSRKKVEAFLTRINELNTKIERIEKGDFAPQASILSAVQALQPDADRLVQDSATMPAPQRNELASNASGLQNRLRVMEKSELEERDRTVKLQQITDAVGNQVGYREALASYLRAFPDSRSEDFRKVQEKEQAVWDRVTSWNAFVAGHGKLNVTTLPPQDAAKTAAEISELANDHAGFPGRDELLTRMPYLQSVAARQADGGKLTDQLKPVFEHFTVANLFYARLTDTRGEQNYYSTSPIVMPVADKPGSIMYLTGTDVASLAKPKSFKTQDLVPGAHGDAPQSAFSRKLLTDTRFIKSGEWEQVFVTLIPQLYEDKWMDPVVKIQLLPNLMQVAGMGSSALQTAMQPQFEALQNELEVAVNWISPLDDKAPAVRRQAENLLRVMPPFQLAFDQAREELKRLAVPPVNQTFEWVGWLCREKGDRWTCRTKVTQKDLSGDLCVVAPGATDAETRFDVIGKIDHGVPQLSATASSAYLEGRPVYVVKVAP